MGVVKDVDVMKFCSYIFICFLKDAALSTLLESQCPSLINRPGVAGAVL